MPDPGKIRPRTNTIDLVDFLSRLRILNNLRGSFYYSLNVLANDNHSFFLFNLDRLLCFNFLFWFIDRLSFCFLLFLFTFILRAELFLLFLLFQFIFCWFLRVSILNWILLFVFAIGKVVKALPTVMAHSQILFVWEAPFTKQKSEGIAPETAS